jgi:hypothetical protein
MIRVVADPAAFAASDRQDNEHDWLLAFQKALGLASTARSRTAGVAQRGDLAGAAGARRLCGRSELQAPDQGPSRRLSLPESSAEIATGEAKGHLAIRHDLHARRRCRAICRARGRDELRRRRGGASDIVNGLGGVEAAPTGGKTTLGQ